MYTKFLEKFEFTVLPYALKAFVHGGQATANFQLVNGYKFKGGFNQLADGDE